VFLPGRLKRPRDSRTELFFASIRVELRAPCAATPAPSKWLLKTTTMPPKHHNYLLGIDIGGTKIAGGIVDASTGAVLLQERVATLAADGGAAVLARALSLAARLRNAARSQDIGEPAGVGVGAGGQIDPETGVVVAATDVLPGWAGTRLRDAFEERLGLPARVDNDVNALAAGECRWGAAQSARNVVFLALGTGVGGALIVNGRLHHGARGAGGELGHLVVVPDGPPCTCGGNGCLEQYASGPALLARFHALGGDPAITHGTPLADLAAREPNGPAARAIAETGKWLGLSLVSLANVFGPDRFVIGGGLASLGDRLLDPARRVLTARALPGVRSVPILPAALGTSASIVGAAALALEITGD